MYELALSKTMDFRLKSPWTYLGNLTNVGTHYLEAVKLMSAPPPPPPSGERAGMLDMPSPPVPSVLMNG